MRVSKFPADGAGDDDGVVPDPCLVEGAAESRICVLDEWLAWTMRKGLDVRGTWEPQNCDARLGRGLRRSAGVLRQAT